MVWVFVSSALFDLLTIHSASAKGLALGVGHAIRTAAAISLVEKSGCVCHVALLLMVLRLQMLRDN